MKVYITSCKCHISGTNSHCKLNCKGQQSLFLHKLNKKFVGAVSFKVLSTDLFDRNRGRFSKFLAPIR